MKVFRRVPKEELRLGKASQRTLAIWWEKHLLCVGDYETMGDKFLELTSENPEPTVAIGYEE